MSYLMVMRMQANPDDLKRVMAAHEDDMRNIAQASKDAGAIHHAFYVGEGEVLVVDEWDRPESFQKFFQEQQSSIGPMFEEGGVQGEPEVNFFEKLDSVDAF